MERRADVQLHTTLKMRDKIHYEISHGDLDPGDVEEQLFQAFDDIGALESECSRLREKIAAMTLREEVAEKVAKIASLVGKWRGKDMAEVMSHLTSDPLSLAAVLEEWRAAKEKV